MALGILEEQALAFGLEFVKSKPEIAMCALLLKTPIKGYLIDTLSKEQLQFLSDDLDRDPLGLIKFCKSPEGKESVRNVFELYKQSIQKGNQS